MSGRRAAATRPYNAVLLAHAAYSERFDIVLRLLREGQSVNEDHRELLGPAIAYGHRELAEFLIWGGADLEEAFYSFMPSYCHLHGRPDDPRYWRFDLLFSANIKELHRKKIPVIHLVAKSPSLIEYYFTRGFDINELRKSSSYESLLDTPLIACLRDGTSPDSALKLLELGADPFIPVSLASKRCSTLLLASRKDAFVRVVCVLLSKGLPLRDSATSDSALMEAVLYDAVENVQVLLDAGADPDECDSLPLRSAFSGSQAPNLKLSNVLIRNGATVPPDFVRRCFQPAYNHSHEFAALLLVSCSNLNTATIHSVAPILGATSADAETVVRNLAALSPIKPEKLR